MKINYSNNLSQIVLVDGLTRSWKIIFMPNDCLIKEI